MLMLGRYVPLCHPCSKRCILDILNKIMRVGPCIVAHLQRHRINLEMLCNKNPNMRIRDIPVRILMIPIHDFAW